MRFFIDTADIDEIKDASKLGILYGVTTNPSLVAKANKPYKEVIKEIIEIVDGPISAEVISLTCDEMVKEAKELSKIHKNIVVKIPFIKEGLKALKIVSELGIKTNVTLIFSANQALMAARAGATYVSPFIGRLDNIGGDGIGLVNEIAEIFLLHNIDTKIIAASIRHPRHVIESALAGAHIATVPYKVLMEMIEHPLTDIGLEKFLSDYKKLEK